LKENKTVKHIYPQKKAHDLSDQEKETIRTRISAGECTKEDTYNLASEFGCSSSQVAGIKAAMNRK
jgi:hypothetical protein